MKLWIKIQSGEKITSDAVITLNGHLSSNTLSDVLRENLDAMDLPTPMVLPIHARKLKSFNIVRFKADDFIESINFSSMVIELIPDEKKMRENLERSLMNVTYLNTYIGYENAAVVAKLAHKENISVKEAVLKLGFMEEEKIDEIFDSVFNS